MARRDTSSTADAVQIGALRKLSGAERLAIAVDMSLTVRELALARLRRERPGASRRELLRELLRMAFAPGTLPPPLR